VIFNLFGNHFEYAWLFCIVHKFDPKWVITQTHIKITKLNSMVWVRERTIPTERPPFVGEVIANFWGKRVPHGQRDGSLGPYSRFSRQEQLLSLPSSSAVVGLLTRPSGPRSRPTNFQKSGSAGNWIWTSGSVAKNSDH
jgi:hypothetical protein